MSPISCRIMLPQPQKNTKLTKKVKISVLSKLFFGGILPVGCSFQFQDHQVAWHWRQGCGEKKMRTIGISVTKLEIIMWNSLKSGRGFPKFWLFLDDLKSLWYCLSGYYRWCCVLGGIIIESVVLEFSGWWFTMLINSRLPGATSARQVFPVLVYSHYPRKCKHLPSITIYSKLCAKSFMTELSWTGLY